MERTKRVTIRQEELRQFQELKAEMEAKTEQFNSFHRELIQAMKDKASIEPGPLICLLENSGYEEVHYTRHALSELLTRKQMARLKSVIKPVRRNRLLVVPSDPLAPGKPAIFIDLY